MSSYQIGVLLSAEIAGPEVDVDSGDGLEISGSDGSHVVSVLQDPFHPQKGFADEQKPVLLEQVGVNHDVGYSALILQTHEEKPASRLGSLASDNSSHHSHSFSVS